MTGRTIRATVAAASAAILLGATPVAAHPGHEGAVTLLHHVPGGAALAALALVAAVAAGLGRRVRTPGVRSEHERSPD